MFFLGRKETFPSRHRQCVLTSALRWRFLSLQPLWNCSRAFPRHLRVHPWMKARSGSAPPAVVQVKCVITPLGNCSSRSFYRKRGAGGGGVSRRTSLKRERSAFLWVADRTTRLTKTVTFCESWDDKKNDNLQFLQECTSNRFSLLKCYLKWMQHPTKNKTNKQKINV